MLVSSTGVLGSFVEELLCSFWEGAGQRGVTSLAHNELFVVSGRSLAVQGEWVLALCLQSRIEAEHIPVAAVNSAFHLFLAVGHAALDRVHLTWSVADYQGRTRISFRLSQSLDGLVHVSAHRDLCYIDVAVGHCNLCQALLGNRLTSSSKLCYLTDLGSLGSLTAGVGVNLGVEYHDVDIFAGSQNVVQTAEADIVCPAVAAEYPNGFLGEVLFVFEDFLCLVAAAGFQSSDQLLGSSLVLFAVVDGVQIFLASSLNSLVAAVLDQVANLLDQAVTNNLLAQVHTEAVLRVVLEQGVCPSRTMALCVDGVWRGSSRTAPDGGAAGCVGDVHSVAEQLRDQTSVSGLSTTSAGAGDLEQRFLELAALNGLFSRHAWLLANVGNQVIEYRLFCFLALSWNHLDGLFFSRALAYADAAAHAVPRRTTHGEFVAFQALADHLRGVQASRCDITLFFVQREVT